MKELLVISGKGGTGKTSVTGALATLIEKAVIADCDVDAADLHLILQPAIKEVREFVGSQKASIDSEQCSGCGRCAQSCRFDAIELVNSHYQVNEVACEGCGVCKLVCPDKAVTLSDHVSGQLFVSETPWGPMVHATLGVAEENSGKLVAEVRKTARRLAETRGLNLALVDGPPGIGCPVISSITGVDAVLIVTEPTISGLHDLERVARLAKHFQVKAFVVINKYDLHEEATRRISRYCDANDLELIGKIPFDEAVTRAMIAGTPLGNLPDSDAFRAIRKIWDRVVAAL